MTVEQPRLTEEALGRLSAGEYERLVNDYLREEHPNLISTGATAKDAFRGFPVDALGYEPGQPPTWVLAASTTTQEKDLVEKWIGQGKEGNDIKKAAEHYGITVEERDWRELGKRPHTRNAAHER